MKALHIVSMTAWMAGLFYLPRLFVYHSKVPKTSESARLFVIMERRLYKIIMIPGMLSSLLSGLWLSLIPGIVNWARPGFHLKLFCVGALVFYQHCLNHWRKQLAKGTCLKKEMFFRLINEIPTLLLIIIVICVTVKPF